MSKSGGATVPPVPIAMVVSYAHDNCFMIRIHITVYYWMKYLVVPILVQFSGGWYSHSELLYKCVVSRAWFGCKLDTSATTKKNATKLKCWYIAIRLTQPILRC